jgi:hypothetical protein
MCDQEQKKQINMKQKQKLSSTRQNATPNNMHVWIIKLSFLFLKLN